jgi:large subunit ribosomal protein L1
VLQLSKKYSEKEKLVERGRLYGLDEAIDLVKRTAWASFEETIDMAVKLGYTPKKGETIRGTIGLPAGTGKSIKVAALVSSDRQKEVEDAGADIVGGDDLIEKIKNGFLGFDVLLATPDMMPKVGKLGKLLGTKGLMPNPKSGTVTADIGKTVKEFKAGKIEFKADKGGVIHLHIGKVKFESEKIKQNFMKAWESVQKTKPSAAKGVQYIKSISLSSTMGPGIKVDLKAIEEK